MTQAAERLHGASLAAPGEGFSPDESPGFSGVRSGSAGRGRLEEGAPGVVSTLRVLLGILLVVGVSIAVALGAYRYALNSPRFAIRSIDLDGGRRFGAEQVRALGGIAPKANLFALDTAGVERKLLENPWIARAQVSVRLPSTLKVSLKEREALAIAIVSGHPYLVSAEAEPFKRLDPGESADLPVITGVHSEELARNRRQELERLALALDVLREYRKLALSRTYAPQEVHLTEAGQVSLVVGQQGILIALGKGPFRQRLLMAERVVSEARRAGKLPSVVFADNVAHPERVVVRLR